MAFSCDYKAPIFIYTYDGFSEKTMAPHSSTLAWKIPWMEEPSRLQSMGSLGVGTPLSDFTFTFHFSCIGEGNGNPLQCSCLENPRDRGGWWASIYGVSHSRTRLKQLSSSSRTAAYQAPPSMGISRQEYWNGVPLPSPNKSINIYK